jgi:capsule polysaccharide export protein KpsE/RkpR
MKSKWTSIIATLGIVELVSTADGSYLNNEQLDTLDAKMAEQASQILTLTDEKNALTQTIADHKKTMESAVSDAVKIANDEAKVALDAQIAEVARLNAIVSGEPANKTTLQKSGEEGIVAATATFDVSKSAGMSQALIDRANQA